MNAQNPVSAPLPPDFAAMPEKLRALKGSGRQLDLSRFSWKGSQEMLKDFKGNFTDLLRGERND